MRDILSDYIEEKRVEGSLREELLSLKGDDATSVMELLMELSPSANTLRQLYLLASESGAREGRPISSILSEEELREIYSRPGKSRKEKTSLFRSALERIRYPELTRIAGELEDLKAQLLKETSVRVSYPVDYEGDALQVNFSFRSPEDFEKGAARLKAASEHPALQKIFELLTGQGD